MRPRGSMKSRRKKRIEEEMEMIRKTRGETMVQKE